MAEVDVGQTSFNAGELSPRVYGRTDLDQYRAGVRTLLNALILPQGGLTRRPGTRFVHEVKDSSKTTRLIRFIFSTEQPYILEFGDLYMRVYKDEAIVETAPNVPFELVTTYTQAQVQQLRFAQSADTLYIVHPLHFPRKLTRTSDTSWAIADVPFREGPYLPQNATDTKLNPAATTGTFTLTADSTTGINDDQGFLSTDVGRLIRLFHTDEWGYGRIDSINSTTSVEFTVLGQLKGSTPTDTWQLGAWYIDNYPRAVMFSQGRLIFAGEANTPDTIHASVSQLFENFQPTGDPTENYPVPPTVADDNSFDFTIASGEVNAILWARSLRNATFGTSGGIFEMRASAFGEAVTPLNVNVPESLITGSANVDPIKVGQGLVFMGRASRRVRNLAFSFEDDGLLSSDLTLLSEHITESGVLELAFAEEQDGWIAARRADGRLVIGVVVPEQRVVGWARHEIGGSFSGGVAQVVSVSQIPAPNIDHDQFWFIVKRTVNGVTRQYVEFLEEPFRSIEADTPQEDAFFVDSGLTGTSGTPTDTWSGLDHLEGETVSILADGAVEPDEVVSGGSITLQRAVSKVQVGLSYATDVELLPADPTQSGAAAGKQQRFVDLLIRVLDTLGGQVGPDASSLDPILYREGDDLMDQPPPLFSGILDLNLETGYERDPTILFRQDQPLPFTLLAVAHQANVGDR